MQAMAKSVGGIVLFLLTERKQFMEWLSVFDSAAREFRQFLDENDQGE